MRRLAAVSCLWLACVTPRPLQQRVDALADEGPSCERFSTFDPRARALLDELLAGAPGDQLVSASARLNAARRACARHTLDGLLRLREAEGVGAVQAELDALVLAWPVDRVEALLAQTPGLDLAALSPMVMEARERAARAAQTSARERRDERERDAQASTGRVEAAGADCIGLTGCGAASCLAALVRAGAEAAPLAPLARTAARSCLDESRARTAGDRAERISALMTALAAFGGLPEDTEARLALETLRRGLWAEVEAARAANQPARAFVLASPYVVLDSARSAVESVRKEAIAAHQGHARACGNRALCARLHRRLAASLGGPDEPPLTAPPGRWERGRWACRRSPVALPDAPPAMTVRLDATCRRPQKRAHEDDEYRIFQLEQEMMGHALEGEVRATCAGRLPSAPIRALGFVDDAEMEDDGAGVRLEVERVLQRLVTDCQRLHAEAAQRACADLGTSSPEDVVQRFAESAVVTGTWASCFEAWFLRRYGVPPPAVELPAPGDEGPVR